MKKTLVSVIMLVGCAVALAGCGGSKTTKIDNKQIATEFANAPSWVLDGGGSMEGGIAAVGSAAVGKAGMNFARTEALANGRDELARQLSLKVKNMVKNFTQTTGLGDSETVDKVSSQVSKQVANQTINGSRQKDSWISPSANLYILVAVDSSIAKDAIKNAVQTSLRNEQALWQQFQAKKAYDDLDKEIEKEFGDFKN